MPIVRNLWTLPLLPDIWSRSTSLLVLPTFSLGSSVDLSGKIVDMSKVGRAQFPIEYYMYWYSVPLVVSSKGHTIRGTWYKSVCVELHGNKVQVQYDHTAPIHNPTVTGSNLGVAQTNMSTRADTQNIFWNLLMGSPPGPDEHLGVIVVFR
jgi:hypothetical protein